MQIGEAIALMDSPEPQEESKCNPPETDTTNWSVVIDGIKGEGSAATLKTNLEAFGTSVPEYPNKLSLGWDLFECNPNKFPTQTHHLIPEKYLPKQKVTAWLTDSPKSECKHPKYELEGDTYYDTNGAKNGYFMPFASTTHQWNAKSSKQKEVCFEMMRRTRIQLHQSRHSHTDYMERIEVETSGYKTQVKEFLQEIDRLVFTHVEKCETCSNKGKKTKIPPLESTVKMVEQASHLMKVLLLLNRVAVSKRAANYIIEHLGGGKKPHPTEPFVTPADF